LRAGLVQPGGGIKPSLKAAASEGYGPAMKKPATTRFSYTEVWEDAVAMLRSNAPLLSAIAGAFFFLPSLLIGYLLARPEGADTFEAMIEAFEAYYAANWHWLLLANIVNMAGAIAIYLLLLGGRGRTVGEAIGGALPILPFYFILSFLTTAAIIVGLFWLVLPGLYLLGRFAVSSPAMVAEGLRNPFDAIRRSWRMTRDKGWAVVGLIILVGFAAYLVSTAISVTLGTLILLLLGKEGLGLLLITLIASALSAAFSIVMVVLFAAIYRRLERV
jgi:hypothetical protein